MYQSQLLIMLEMEIKFRTFVQFFFAIDWVQNQFVVCVYVRIFVSKY
jgi:hypothetical protein